MAFLKMSATLVRLLLILCCFVCSDQLISQFKQNPELEWEKMAKVIREEASGPMPNVSRSRSHSQTSSSEIRMLPKYLVVSSAKNQKVLFNPEKGVRPLPNSVKALLFPSAAMASPAGSRTRPKPVEILCHIDRLYVRVRRDLFKTLDAFRYLKLGTCPVNQGTTDHYYFLYHLTSGCGFKRESNVDDFTVRNVLRYMPNTPFLREMPFDVPLQCKYHRLLHSYKVGFWPTLQQGTVFKSLKRRDAFLLIPQDASGNKMRQPYILGHPMFFEAKRPDGTASFADDRMYINQCFMTSYRDPNSSPKYTIIDNFGCMMDGKQSAESKFLRGSSMLTQRFTLSALILREMLSSSTTQQLYMHCDLFMGQLTPTNGQKACNYESATRRWKELYGDHSVCTCCDSTCYSPQHPRASSKMVTSHPWKVDFKEDDLDMKTLDAALSFESEGMDTDVLDQLEDDQPKL